MDATSKARLAQSLAGPGPASQQAEMLEALATSFSAAEELPLQVRAATSHAPAPHQLTWRPEGGRSGSRYVIAVVLCCHTG